MNGNAELRKHLDDIIHLKNKVENWYTPHLFEQFTKNQLPQEITLLLPPPHEDLNYNCFIYALGLESDAKFLGSENWDFMRWLDKDFEMMIATRVLKRLDSPEKGCLAIWSNDKRMITHAGVVEDENTAISKWSWGPLFRHRFFDVPASYGDEVEFYEGVLEARECIKLKRNKEQKIFRDKDIFPNSIASSSTVFETRIAVKIILLDEDNKLALVGTKHRLLPGGGLELDEHIFDAAVREAREEVGCAIKIIREIGTTEEFREKIGRHQITHFLLASVDGVKGLPETKQKDEQGIVVLWHTLDEVVELLEKQKNEISFTEYNACFNVRTHLAVLQDLQRGGTLLL